MSAHDLIMTVATFAAINTWYCLRDRRKLQGQRPGVITEIVKIAVWTGVTTYIALCLELVLRILIRLAHA